MEKKINCLICNFQYKSVPRPSRGRSYDTDYWLIDGYCVCNGSYGSPQCKKKLIEQLGWVI